MLARRHPGRDFQQTRTRRRLGAARPYRRGRLLRYWTHRTENVGRRRISALMVDKAVSVQLQHPFLDDLQRDAADRCGFGPKRTRHAPSRANQYNSRRKSVEISGWQRGQTRRTDLAPHMDFSI